MDKKDLMDTLNHIKICNRKIYLTYNFSDILSSIMQTRLDKVQSYKLEPLAEIFNKMKIEAIEVFRKIAILECLLNSWYDMFSERYTQSIQDQFMKTSERLLTMCQSDEGWSLHIEDVYWKDLAIARQQIFPAGALIVEAYSGFGLRQGISLNLIQTFSFLELLILNGGRTGYYQVHIHTPALNEFNQEGRNDCYVRIAEMLEKHIKIKGVVGQSWFYDPQILNISPGLTYLQEVPFKYGAKRFYSGEDKSGNALVKSETRLKLFNEGKYRPKSYLMVWPRKAIIEWANKYKSIE